MAYTLKQLTMAYTAVHGGVEPDAAAQEMLRILSYSDQQALSYILKSAGGTTAVAALTYQFFTGRTPTKDGLAYLLNSATNANDLNDAYYAGFNTENRYINFAANLGVQGEGAAAFAAKYGAMSFSDYVTSIYETIIGASYAQAAGIDIAKSIAYVVGARDTLLATARGSGMITAGMTDAQIDLALKAAAAGVLMSEAVKSDIGLYAGSVNNLMLAMAQDNAAYGSNLVATYAPGAWTGASGTGSAITTLPSVLPGGPPPPEPEPDPVPVSQTFTLTTGVDTFTGQGADDTFNATLSTGATLNAGDTLDGAGGVDTLSITSSGTFAFAMSSVAISRIERLVANSAANTLTLNMPGAAIFTEVMNNGSTGDVMFMGLGAITKMAVANGGAGRSTYFDYAAAALAGNADIADLSVTNVTGAKISLTTTSSATNMFETLNIASNGTANVFSLATDSTQTSLATINVTGAAPLTLTFNGASEMTRTVATIDASASTGGVTIGSATTTLGVADQTVKLGSGDDTVLFGTNLTGADIVDGGAGHDAVGVTNAITDASILNNVSNVEAVRFDPISGSTFTQNAAVLAGRGLVDLQLNRFGLSTASFSNLANAMTVTLLSTMAGAQLNLSLADGSGVSDSLTLNLASLTTTAAGLGTLVSITGLETLNIVTGGAASGYTITSNAVIAKQLITGSKPLTMTASNPTAFNVDASAFTAKLTITGATSQNDVVVLGTGADVVNLRGGTDTIYLGPTTDTSHAYRGADAITASNTTTIVFTDNTETVGGGASVTYAGVMAATGAAARLAFSAGDDHFSVRNAAGVSAHGLSKGSTAHGLNAGDAMVVQALAQSGGVTAADLNVSLIKLATQTAFATDIKTTFAAAMGASSITGLAADSAYLVSMFDGSKVLLALVNTGASGAGDTTLSAADFTDTGVVLIGTFAMPPQNVLLGTAI